ncbi:PREDICTED: inositol polyphosphate multikinase [Polistes canadensis]|uniref:inositol polyphosphate multikinase n=1 Tax=Polistes canadensis TaxID=91411 RepID=UPI000718EB8C|nr:PREDICTED: inositol polyphosphate multikinase [Polistes canadensis]XP_014609931.1 PREDICTED: inositol polyphosphate multikinase [Polistes canadensis]XP_014609932.1 PREDICTED: inositol polyphosphate multikinase [Polistes canadensis]
MTSLNSCPDKSSCHRDDSSRDAELDVNKLENKLPEELCRLNSQVAGHYFDNEKNSIGMLRTPLGRVLKPIIKPHLGEREITFYENLKSSQDETTLELRNHVPEYFGTTEILYSEKKIQFVVLQDITDGMAEPCVMDIKIGKRTWDPLASEEKKISEERKYAQLKEAYGFCITGFQVYCLPNGELKKFDKNYGKMLTPEGVVEALKIFLNVTPQRPKVYRLLIVKLLSLLWEILVIFRKQTNFRFYSSSLLIAYDAGRLRYCLHLEKEDKKELSRYCQRAKSFSSTLSPTMDKEKNLDKDQSCSSKDTSAPPSPTQSVSCLRRKVLEKTRSLKRSVSLQFGSKECSSSFEKDNTTKENKKLSPILKRNDSYDPNFKVDRLCRTHSQVHNFDQELANMKEDYFALLNELSNTSEDKNNWVRVNMIDFTHVFPAPNETAGLDFNYLEGIGNLIKLFETFLT